MSDQGRPPQFEGHDIHIGAGATFGVFDDWFQGDLDDRRLYARALDAEEIQVIREDALQ